MAGYVFFFFLIGSEQRAKIYFSPLNSSFPQLLLKPWPHERFFTRAGDAIFSNFVASPARDENRTCSHPRTCNATGEKIARKKSPELKFSRQNRRDSARVATLQLSLVIRNSSGNAGISTTEISARSCGSNPCSFLLASHERNHPDLFLIFFFLRLLFIVKKKMQKGEKQYLRFGRSKSRSVYSARSLEVCDSRGFQFVAKLARICHSCSHPLALATRQNLKKSHHLRDQKIARVAAA